MEVVVEVAAAVEAERVVDNSNHRIGSYFDQFPVPKETVLEYRRRDHHRHKIFGICHQMLIDMISKFRIRGGYIKAQPDTLKIGASPWDLE